MNVDHENAIRQRAHEIWEEFGRSEGQEEDHWRQAEADLGLDQREELPKGSGVDGPSTDQAPLAPPGGPGQGTGSR
jgi:hypothetical protein